MTKEDILALTTGREIIKAMFAHPELVDKEVSDYQIAVSKKEYIEEYGSLDIRVDPLLRK